MSLRCWTGLLSIIYEVSTRNGMWNYSKKRRTSDGRSEVAGNTNCASGSQHFAVSRFVLVNSFEWCHHLGHESSHDAGNVHQWTLSSNKNFQIPKTFYKDVNLSPLCPEAFRIREQRSEPQFWRHPCGKLSTLWERRLVKWFSFQEFRNLGMRKIWINGWTKMMKKFESNVRKNEYSASRNAHDWRDNRGNVPIFHASVFWCPSSDRVSRAENPVFGGSAGYSPKTRVHYILDREDVVRGDGEFSTRN